MIAAQTFWDVNAGQVSILASMLGGFLLWFSRFEGRVKSATDGLKEHAELLDRVTKRIEQMDREGTRKSQQSIAADEKLYEINTLRLNKLENIVTDLAPKVAAMATNVEWLAGYVRRNGSEPFKA